MFSPPQWVCALRSGNNTIMEPGPSDNWLDLRKMLESEFWTELSDDDEGIGSDESLERVSNSSNEGELKKKKKEPDISSNKPKDPEKRIKRSRSVVAINQLRNKIIGPITRRLQDDKESVSYGGARIDVFGLSLTSLCIKTGSQIPEIVTFCTDYIQKIGITDGIYRISGQTAVVESMKTIFEQRKIPASIAEKDVHSLASVLKLFFRSLPDPLLAYSQYDRMLEISRQPVHHHGELLRAAVLKLPHHHLKTVKYLLAHLHYLSQHHNTTGMTSRNLAIVWAPNLIRPPSRDINWRDCGQHAIVIESLIVNFKQVFCDSEQEHSVNEVSIDAAIEEERKTIKRATSHCDIKPTSTRSVGSDTALKRCKSESRNINSMSGSLGRFENQNIDLSGWFKREAGDDDFMFESLCDRHRNMLERSEHEIEYESRTRSFNKKLIKNIGKLRSSKSRLFGALSRMSGVRCFRTGNYQVSVETDKYREKKLCQPSEYNNLPTDGECHYFQDVERVLKQFEYLEDELDCRRRIPKIMKNADVVVGSSVKPREMGADSSSGGEVSSNLEALQKLQNSVNEVNRLFSSQPRTEQTEGVNSGIFYAELVIAR